MLFVYVSAMIQRRRWPDEAQFEQEVSISTQLQHHIQQPYGIVSDALNGAMNSF